ncbi:MAG: S8 family serine peptidase [Alistipes putredinis]|nr:MAG: S8 family serine peptidase [Alistipes putredinis]
MEIIGEVGARLDLWYKLACSTQSDCDALAMSARFYESGLFQYAEPDIMFEVRSCSKQPNSYPEYQAPTRAADAPAPNDPLFPQQWYLHNPGGLDINYLEAKAITQGSSDIKILLSDIQEITCDHPDLPEIVKYELPIDADDLHGTACAGIISAKTNNGEGITGIAPNCQLYYVQVPNTYNIDNAPTIADVFGCAFGMDVMSCSWHIPYIFDEHDCTMIETAIAMRFQDGRWHHTCEKDLGTVIVFAAGNDNSYDVCYPAITFSETIAVGAMLKNGKRHPLSNYGIRLDLVAPGENIVTTTTTIAGFDERYYTPFFDMTSSACPQVAGCGSTHIICKSRSILL